MAKSQLFSVVTAEPDIVANSPNGPVTFACKHPDSLRGVSACIEGGAAQVAKQGHPGIVVVSLDAVVHEVGRWLGVKDPEDVVAWSLAQLDRIAQASDAATKKALGMSPVVAGIVAVLVVGYVAEGPPRTSGFRMVLRSFHNPSVGGSKELVNLFMRVLYD